MSRWASWRQTCGCKVVWLLIVTVPYSKPCISLLVEWKQLSFVKAIKKVDNQIGQTSMQITFDAPLQKRAEPHNQGSKRSLLSKQEKGSCASSTLTHYITIMIVFYRKFRCTMSGSLSLITLYQVIVKQLFHCT